MTTTLITGANKGLGYATARELICAGHTVYVGSRDAERGRRAAAELGGRPIRVDVTDDASVAAAAAEVRAADGLDVLINNAGIAPEWRSDGSVVEPGDLTGDVMRATLETNVIGVVRVMQAFLPILLQSDAPVVVNVSSGLASLSRMSGPDITGRDPRAVAYPTSKAALNMITVQYAKSFPTIRINAVEPGYTSTDLNGRRGHQTPEQGAATIAAMALVEPDGPTGSYVGAAGALPW